MSGTEKESQGTPPDEGPCRPPGFKKGQSGCPGGQHGTRKFQDRLEGKRGDRAIQKIFRRKSVRVVHALSRIIADPELPASVRVAAAQLFLERGWGKIESDAAPKGSRRNANRRIIVVPPVMRDGDGE